MVVVAVLMLLLIAQLGTHIRRCPPGADNPRSR